MAIIIFSAVFIFPFFVWFLLWKNIETLDKEESILRFGSTYLELKTDSKNALLYNVFYMLRRLLFAAVALLMPWNAVA